MRVCIWLCEITANSRFFLSSKSFRSFKMCIFFVHVVHVRTAKQQPQDEISNVKVPQVHLELTNN